MSRLAFIGLVVMAIQMQTADAVAQVRFIPEFTGDAQEDFDECTINLGKPCMAPDCPMLFGSRANTLCTPGHSGIQTGGSLGSTCVIDARSAPRLVFSSPGWVRYTFDPPVARFGGYFGGPVPKRGENGDAYLRFRDENGNDLGTRVARVGDGEWRIGDGWHWSGWESTGAPIAEIDVEGMLLDGRLIPMDDMEISYTAEIQCDRVRQLKLSCRGGTLEAVVKTRMEPGTRITIMDMDISRSVKVNRHGKAKAKFDSRPGRHRVYIEECPKFDEVVQCED